MCFGSRDQEWLTQCTETEQKMMFELVFEGCIWDYSLGNIYICLWGWHRVASCSPTPCPLLSGHATGLYQMLLCDSVLLCASPCLTCNNLHSWVSLFSLPLESPWKPCVKGCRATRWKDSKSQNYHLEENHLPGRNTCFGFQLSKE